MASHRIFVAVPVSEKFQSGVLEWRNQHHTLSVRWLEGKNLHVTLLPPWAEDEQRLPAVREALRMLGGRGGAFRMQFSLVRYGPTARAPRLIWAEGEAPPELLTLKHEVERALDRLGSEKPFLLHLTLARFRPEDFAKFSVQKIHDVVSWEEEVNSLVLMESHLAKTGADYEILETVTL